MNKPNGAAREFWGAKTDNDSNGRITFFTDRERAIDSGKRRASESFAIIHVIEHSAFLKQQKISEVLRAALKEWLDWESQVAKKYLGQRINELILRGVKAIEEADRIEKGGVNEKER